MFDHAQDAEYRSAVSLSGTAYATSAAHLDALASNAMAPAVVRSLARCIREAMASSVPETVDPSLILFDYVCGTKYRVRNTGAKWIDVTYQLYHLAEHGDLSVAPGGEATIQVDGPYAVALYYRGQLLRDAQNGQTVCPP